MPIVANSTQIIIEERVVLHDVPWEIYEGLMTTHTDHSAPRFTYDQGQLEIYMPSQKHEKNAELLGDLVKTIAEERDIEVLSLGSTTFKKEESAKGVEPDGCFYLQSYEVVFGTEKIDIEVFPPDLVLEIDVTSPSIERFPIYADFRVPEIWRHVKEKVKIYILHGSAYIEVGESLVFPQVTATVLTGFLLASQTEKRSLWLKSVREWMRAHS